MNGEQITPETVSTWTTRKEQPPTEKNDFSSLDEYEPSEEQTNRFELLRAICQACEAADIKISITGGYGLDGLYGKLTRDHDDLDILVEGGKESQFAVILESLGFIRDFSVTARDTYNHVEQNFKIDCGSITRLPEVTDEPASTFLPNEPNALIQDVHFRTPTPEGHRLAIELLTTRAKQLGWREYPPQKLENKHLILSALEGRKKEQNDELRKIGTS